MDFSYILHSSVINQEKLIQFGFTKLKSEAESETKANLNLENCFILRRNLNSDFYTEISITSEKILAQVFECETGEKYVLVDVQNAQGKFVGGLREQIRNLIEEIRLHCFTSLDLKADYVQWLENDLGITGDFPWENDNNSAVYRCKNGKWFALIMKIKFKNLGFESEEPVWAVNLKADVEKIPEIVDKKSIFPAWHMNKKYWITVLLTSVTDFDNLKKITVRSKELVEKKK